MTHLQKFQQRMGAEAALISTSRNQFYLSHFRYDDGYLLIFADEAYLLADFRYYEAACMAVTEGFTIVRPEGGMLDEVKNLMAKRGAKTLLVEEKSITLATEALMKKKLEGITLLLGASALLADLRIIKD